MSYPGAKQLAEAVLTSPKQLKTDEQIVLARGYVLQAKQIARLKKELAGCSARVHRAYNSGVNDGLSRAHSRPGFGDMGG